MPMHPLPRRRLLSCLALATFALLAPAAHAAEAWPAKPIQLVIPYPPGGSADLLGRPLAVQLQQQLGQPVVLEYKPGAGGTLAPSRSSATRWVLPTRALSHSRSSAAAGVASGRATA